MSAPVREFWTISWSYAGEPCGMASADNVDEARTHAYVESQHHRVATISNRQGHFETYVNGMLRTAARS